MNAELTALERSNDWLKNQHPEMEGEMKPNNLRPVIAKVWDTESQAWDSFTGIFHQWGNELLESRDGDHTFTVAIVERENGKVESVAPGNICFTD